MGIVERCQNTGNELLKLITASDKRLEKKNERILVLQRDFTFPTEPSVAFDETNKQPRGDAGSN
jgi:hypothetical protein